MAVETTPRRARVSNRLKGAAVVAGALVGLGTGAGLALAAQAPVAALVGPGSVPVGRQVTFDASGSKHDPSATIVDYRWDLDGSGQFATDTHTSPTATTTYSTPGSVSVSVRVTDSYGARSTATEVLTVTDSGGSGSGSGAGSGSGSGSGSGGGGGSGTTTPAPPPALPASVLGGNPAAGIAGLTGAELTEIVVGSTNHFASVTGIASRRVNTVVSHGLWVNVLADRAATFRLTMTISAKDAKRLRLAGKNARRPVTVGTGTANLASAGQRPFALRLTGRAASRLRRLRRGVTISVAGIATDTSGHTATVTRGFSIRP